MLIRLKMTKWRKHEDRTIDFTAGLNAIRGANENGKSSMLLAITYALWGAKILPLPMSEMVTWGYPEKDAKVDLILKINGELYNFVRGTNGAECRHSGGVVTGQNEVSKFASELIGVTPDLAMKLMFSTQGGLRGALDSGPTAISSYIETMAGMDLFDRLMDIIGDKLVTGPTTRLDNEVADLQEKLEKGGPVEPDVTDINERIASADRVLRSAEAGLAGAEAEATAANNAYTEAKAKADQRDASIRILAKAEAAQKVRLEQKLKDEAAAAVEVDESRITYLDQMIADGTALEARKGAYKAFVVPTSGEQEWEGDEASLKAAIKVSEVKVRDLQKHLGGLSTDISVLKSKRTTSSICDFCDQDMSKFPAVAKKNAEIDDKVIAKESEYDAVVITLTEAIDELKDLNEVADSAAPVNRFLQTYGQYVEVDNGWVPARVTWKGPIPTGDTDVKGMTLEVKALRATAAAKVAAETRLQQLVVDIEQAEQLITELKAGVTEEVNLDALYTAKFGADTKVADLLKGIRNLRETIQILEANKTRLRAEFEVAKKDFAKVAVDLELKKVQREELVFNNTLVKKIKAARPIVAAKLWSLVLTSVTVLLSNMRGEQSVVTKGPKGFLVNGRPYEAYSGSALDLLGFAIRVAMLNTFIPECSILILDEATSACDDNRTASLLGFIASAGFPQTLLVTHEAASEAVADNVVMI